MALTFIFDFKKLSTKMNFKPMITANVITLSFSLKYYEVLKCFLKPIQQYIS